MPQPTDPQALDELVASVLASSRYKDISPDLVRQIGEQELLKRRSFKEVVKATKNKLHQVSGAFFLNQDQHFTDWLVELRTAALSGEQERLQEASRHIMRHHASTSERLPILDQFYQTLLAEFAPIHSVLDIACGLHPLAIPWMPLATHACYYAYDIQQQMMTFLQEWFTITQIQGHAQMRDVLLSCPTQEVEVAFVLKTIPCLEQIEKRAGLHLLHAIRARHLIVSFPIRSLGGQNKGMLATYEQYFHTLVDNEPWSIKKFVFASELVFVVTK